MLVTRRLFGFSGDALIDDEALGMDCTHCDPGDIADYIDSLQ